MDDVTVNEGSFEECFTNLETVLHRYIKKNDSCHSRCYESTKFIT